MTDVSLSPEIRTRFAPSPTGFMHVGSVRTALFAWLVARSSQNGAFILRIEDTDQARAVDGSIEHIIETLGVLGISIDEGPSNPGQLGPYTQSQRLDIYRRWAQKLIDSGRAYADPYSREQLDEFRADARSKKRAFLYRNYRPDVLPAWDGTTPLRLLSQPKNYAWHDEVMGDLSSGPEVIDDIILMKSDGFPTYNFAHIVDDAEMKITHVIRGQEFIASQPNYLNIYEALGLEWPNFATMPHILGESGTKKLGKRDGAKDVLEYLRDGYVTEALINFIASLGWNDGTEQELFSVDELIEKFDLSRVGRSGARFDLKRLEWMNGQWIRRLALDELTRRVEPFWSDDARLAEPEKRMNVLELVSDRLKTLAELPMMTDYFFTEPTIDWTLADLNKPLRKINSSERSTLLMATVEALEHISDDAFIANTVQACLNQLLTSTDQKPAVLFSLIRLCVCWAPFSPALHDTLATLGKRTTIDRLNHALASLT